MEVAKTTVEYPRNTVNATEHVETTAARTSPVAKNDQADNKTASAIADDNMFVLALLVLHIGSPVKLQL